MRKLFYAGGSIIISDQVCKAVLRYARALAKADRADVIIMRALTPDNRVGMAHMIIGPASQIMSTPTDDLPLDLEDPAMVEILEGRTRRFDPSAPDWDKDVVDVTDFTTFDWDY
jgi:hypothetical protein